ncbi:hypothetical protein [Fimbriiglobus ruber]|uniref:Uncharacterized protein n=1 Tax=Fimbriiglobus ruber TaxID=1908690 RepID=A0A225DCP7_9BACT|nr:hypothetical protein [Fimbriiglobus ruber]OWK37414.1 hypothetical protein FRUB_06534 [Fimbriiglobus ruber]
MPRNEKPKVKSRKAKPSAIFYGRFRIRVLADTLRAFAVGKIVGANEETAGTPTSIADVPELDLVFREVFVSPDTFVNLNPLDEEGRSYWIDLVTAYEGRKFGKAREMASAFADWLDEEYHKRERLQFDDSTHSVLLDGELYSRLRPDGYAILRVLHAHQTPYCTSEVMVLTLRDEATKGGKAFAGFQDFPEGAAGLKRISRAIKYLPADLRQIIMGQKGCGRRLCLKPQ